MELITCNSQIARSPHAERVAPHHRDRQDRRERFGLALAGITKLKPEADVTGTDGFLRYFGAKFGDDLVAFANARYGNALYIMYDGWKVLSQKSRIELLAGDRDSYDRIEHRPGWIEQLRGRVEAYRRRKREEDRLL